MSAIAGGGQFNVIEPESGNKIDFMIARRDAWGREQLGRRHRIPFLPNLEAFAARPEDVIIAKLIYFDEGGSDKHLRDITGIFAAGTQDIDRTYIERWVESLDLKRAWQAVLERIRQ